MKQDAGTAQGSQDYSTGGCVIRPKTQAASTTFTQRHTVVSGHSLFNSTISQLIQMQYIHPPIPPHSPLLIILLHALVSSALSSAHSGQSG